MAAITRILAFASLLLLTLGGCSNTAAKWIGTWEGEREGMVMRDLNDSIAKSLRRIEIKIADSGRYEMVEAGIPSKGEVHFQGDRVILRIMSRFDRALDVAHADMILEMQSDGSVLYTDPDGGHPQPAVLHKTQGLSPTTTSDRSSFLLGLAGSAVLALPLMAIGFIRFRFSQLLVKISQRWLEIDAALRQRHELVQRLLDSTQKNQSDKREPLVEARKEALRAKSISERSAVEEKLSAALYEYEATLEEPLTEVTQSYLTDLTETHKELKSAQVHYNSAVGEYNEFQRKHRLTARMFGLRPRDAFGVSHPQK